METQSEATRQEAQAGPKWQPLDRVARRVFGVLVEKAKTTPDAYPLSLNGLVTGSNQKSNRSPQMTLDNEQVFDAIDKLRALGAVVEVQSSGRVPKYRHLAYEWLGVEKLELAVMTELLLRGAQTIGELRGRAARMDPIPDLATLRPVLDSLVEKRLLVYLTPPGRGAVVTHTLYLPQELEKVRAKYGASESAQPRQRSEDPPPSPTAVATSSGSQQPSDVAALREELAELRDLVEQLQGQMDGLRNQFERQEKQ